MRNRITTTTVSLVGEFEMHGVQHGNGRITVLGFTIGGQMALPTRSFWRGLFAQFDVPAGDGARVDKAEFFSALRKSFPDAMIYYQIAWDDDGNALLLAPRAAATGNEAGRRISAQAVGNQRSSATVFISADPGTLRFSMN